MKLIRIYAILLRHIFNFKHSYDRLSDVFYWPILDLCIWGLTSSYFINRSDAGPNAVPLIVSGLLFWIIVWRAQYEISVNLLTEMWDRNLINIFASPLRFSEWAIALIILGIAKAAISFTFASILAYFLFGINMLQFGLYLAPFSILLLMNGWAAGFFIAGVILRYGSKIQTLAWSFIWAVAPFAAIYYPVAILPGWAQKVSLAVPASYVFEQVRTTLSKGTIDWTPLLIAFLINCLFLVLSIFFIHSSFKKVLNKGLVKVY